MGTDEYLHFLSYLERINNNENQLISQISVALKYYGATPEVTPLLDDLCQMHESRMKMLNLITTLRDKVKPLN